MQELHQQLGFDQLSKFKIRLSTANVRAMLEERMRCRICAYLCELIDHDEAGYFVCAGAIVCEETQRHAQHVGIAWV